MRRHPNWAHSLPKPGEVKRDNVVQLPRRDVAKPEVDEQPEVDADAVRKFLDIQTWVDLEISA